MGDYVNNYTIDRERKFPCSQGQIILLHASTDIA